MTEDKIEAALKSLRPVKVELNRDELMYRAGYAAGASSAAQGPRPQYLWKATTGLMTAATVALAVVLASDNGIEAQPTVAQAVESTDVKDTVDPVPAQTIPPPVEVISKTSPLLLADPSTNYLALRAAVLHRGVETWPTDYREPTPRVTEPRGSGSATVRDLMEELLPVERSYAVPDEEGEESTEAVTHEEESIV